uniref:Roadblock/LAMTOR2 domain-containing protein n=1 Tax=Xiphophorus couchianus TaxID=32473 RepID=A0A3B5MUY5_9TELE
DTYLQNYWRHQEPFCAMIPGEHPPLADVEETLKRIEGHKGVIGTIIVNSEGLPIRTTLDNSTTSLYARLLRSFTTLARSAVRDVDPQNDLTFVRIRSKKQEILVAPGEISVNFILDLVGIRT